MVLVCHFGGVLRYFGVVVNTPRKLHFAGPTNRDYPTVVDPSTDLGLAPPGLVLADGPYPGLLRVAFHAHLMRYVLGGSGWLATPAPSVQLDISARPTTSQIKSQGVFSITTTRVQSRSRARATMEASPVRKVKLSTLTLAEKIGVPLSI